MKNIFEAPFVSEMRSTTANMYRLGWDERNGGNISMLLDEAEVAQYLDVSKVIRTIPIGFEAKALIGKYFIVTGTGKYFKNVDADPETNLGILRIAEDGCTAELLWGYKDGGKFTLKQRDLAWKWYEGKEAVKYLTVELALADTNFKTVTLALETASAMATEEGKTVNKLVFTAEGGKVYASVNPEKDAVATSGKEVDATKTLAITLNQTGTEYGEYNVTVSGEAVGVFKNVGATFGEYASSSATTPLTPFTVQAEMA